MADDGKNANEPTMEEILASIRKIIADEKDPAAPAAEPPAEPPPPEPVAPPPAPAPAEDVLELTQMVQDDGSVVDIASKTPEITPEPPPESGASPTEKEDLVSEKTARTASESLAALASTVQIERMASAIPMTPLGNGGRTLEDMVMELMKPLLRDWLDKNLPGIVEKMVQKEIERIAHRVQE